eukprot:Sspe_Gene.87746::Locus_59516_Transcript_1_1_Confidence_1.000_Length_1587::g.87746::m.87746
MAATDHPPLGDPPDTSQLASIHIEGMGSGTLLINPLCVSHFVAHASAIEPAHTIAFLGDHGAGKSFIIRHLINLDKMRQLALTRREGGREVVENVSSPPVVSDSATGDFEMVKTEGARLYSHRHGTRRDRVYVLDTEGLNGIRDCGSEEKQFRYNGHINPAVQLRIPILAQRADVIVYVWGPDGHNNNDNAVNDAYRQCVSALRLNTSSSRPSSRRRALRPSLLLLLNKQPLRHCYSKRLGNDGSKLLTERDCTDELRLCDARTRHLASNFTDYRCFRLPSRASTWRNALRGTDVFSEGIVCLEQILCDLLRTQTRARLVEKFPSFLVSEKAWVAGLPLMVRTVNQCSSSQTPPTPVTEEEVATWKAAGRDAGRRP